MREEDMAHVFDRFWRAPGAPSGGTGLGLSIASWIVDRHDGRIGVANRETSGARVPRRAGGGAGDRGAGRGPDPLVVLGRLPVVETRSLAPNGRLSGPAQVLSSGHPDRRS